MNDRLATLDDPTALALLTLYATPKLRHDGLQRTLTPNLREGLVTAYGSASAAPSDGDLARATLAFLASYPATATILARLLDGPQADPFGKPGSTVLPVTVAVLLALQTHLHIEPDTPNGWSFVLDKPTANETLLEPVVQKLVRMPGAGAE